MGRSSRRRRQLARDADGVAPPLAGGPPPPGAGLEALAGLVARRAQAEREIDALVRALAANGVGWGDIGRVLGISRQGARQRYVGR